MKIMDAPYIVEAETVGIDAPRTDLEKSSYRRRNLVASELLRARNLIQEAARVLDNSPYDTIWDDEREKLYYKAEDLASQVDTLLDQVKGW